MPVADFDTRSDASRAFIDPNVTYLRTAGYAKLGDGGGAKYVRAPEPPPKTPASWYFANAPDYVIQSYWKLAETHVNLLQFGGVGDGSGEGSTDNAGALEAALLFCRATGARSLEIPGLFRIGREVAVDIDFEIEIWGQGPNRSGFFRGYTVPSGIECEPDPTRERGLLRLTSAALPGQPLRTASGSIIRGLGFLALKGWSGGCAISVVNGQYAQLGNVVLDNIYVSAEAGGAWGGYGLILDGSRNVTDPVALRTCNLSRLNLFGSTCGAMLLKSVRYASIIGGLYNQVPGPSGKIVVTGTPTLPSQDITIVASALSGLSLSHVEQLTVVGAVTGNSPAVVAEETAVNCSIYGVLYGTPTPPSVDVRWTGVSGFINAR